MVTTVTTHLANAETLERQNVTCLEPVADENYRDGPVR